ncbi:hypothetical protein GCM10011321_25660 [Youhaiella tibetensis]|uniref:Uncharacterized protein n=1 Tax=Paradevosia tibetensis TaxID=1447062 RepID=A0A5B9DJJ2_9HYPH|nr:hypothetical protein [Youhaiella tibetensis]QEE19420.1 hypothetical protein FNA67_04180 [Youhaiella tibetensis]GGF33367.1 hypothetical protein GCM10011321_25660 [Youhaiella tibetensis]
MLSHMLATIARKITGIAAGGRLTVAKEKTKAHVLAAPQIIKRHKTTTRDRGQPNLTAIVRATGCSERSSGKTTKLNTPNS